jgi:hypothetical protein
MGKSDERERERAVESSVIHGEVSDKRGRRWRPVCVLLGAGLTVTPHALRNKWLECLERSWIVLRGTSVCPVSYLEM